MSDPLTTIFKIPSTLSDLEPESFADAAQVPHFLIPTDEVDPDFLKKSVLDINRNLHDFRKETIGTNQPYRLCEDVQMITTMYTFLKYWDEIDEDTQDVKDTFIGIMLGALNRLISSMEENQHLFLHEEKEALTVALQFQNSFKLTIYFISVLFMRFNEEDEKRWKDIQKETKNQNKTKVEFNVNGDPYGTKREDLLKSILELVNDHWAAVRLSFRKRMDTSFTDTLFKIGLYGMENMPRMKSVDYRNIFFDYSKRIARAIPDPFSDELGTFIRDSIEKSETLATYLPVFFEELAKEEGRAYGGSLISDAVKSIGEYAPKTEHAIEECKHFEKFFEQCSMHCPAIFVPHLDAIQRNQLDSSSATIRRGVIELLKHIAVDVLQQNNDESSNRTRKKVLEAIEERLMDENGNVRARTLKALRKLAESNAVPLDILNRCIDSAIARLNDSSAHTRKDAIMFLLTTIQHNPYGAVLQAARYQARLDKINDELQRNLTHMDKEQVEQLQLEREMCQGALPYIEKMKQAQEKIHSMLESSTSLDVEAAIHFTTVASMSGLDQQFKGMRTYLKLIWRGSGSEDVTKTLLHDFHDFFFSYQFSDEGTVVDTAVILLRLLSVCSNEDVVSFREVIRRLYLEQLWKPEMTIALFSLFQFKYSEIRQPEVKASLAVMVIEMIASVDADIVRQYQGTFFKTLKENFQRLGPICGNVFETLKYLRDVDAGPTQEPNSKWMALVQVILFHEGFTVEEWMPIAKKGMELIFYLCRDPDAVVDVLFHKFSQAFQNDKNDWQSLTKLIFLLGECGLNDLILLDRKRVLELNELRKKHKEQEENTNTSKKSKKKKKKSKKKRAKEVAADAETDKLLLQDEQEAERADVEEKYKQMRRHLLESKPRYSKLIPIMEQVTSPSVEKMMLRKIAMVTKAKICVVSRKYCVQHLHSIVEIMVNKTAPPDLRCNLLALFSDIICIHTNSAEGYTSYLFNCLNDEKLQVRKESMLVITHLVLGGIMMGTTHIHHLARRVVDDDEFIRESAKSFFYHFHKRSDKYNPIYNHAPDCISKLSSLSDRELPMDQYQEIMSFLFSFIRKDTNIKNLTETLTKRFSTVNDEDPHRVRKWKCISYCLSLLKMQKTSFLKLIESFEKYKHVIPQSMDIKNTFLDIIRAHRKQIASSKDVAYKEQVQKFWETIEQIEAVRQNEIMGDDDAMDDEEEYEEDANEEEGESAPANTENPPKQESDSPQTNQRKRKREESDDEIDFELDEDEEEEYAHQENAPAAAQPEQENTAADLPGSDSEEDLKKQKQKLHQSLNMSGDSVENINTSSASERRRRSKRRRLSSVKKEPEDE